MPTEPLPLDMARETRMFLALVRVLREDPDLDRVVRAWQVYDGSAGELKPLTETELPGIRLTPDIADFALSGPADYWEGVAVAVDFAVAGTSADDRFRLWAAIFAATQRDKPVSFGDNVDGSDFTGSTVEQYLRSNGAAMGKWTAPARLQQHAANQAVTNQYCRAVYTLGAFVPGPVI